MEWSTQVARMGSSLRCIVWLNPFFCVASTYWWVNLQLFGGWTTTPCFGWTCWSQIGGYPGDIRKWHLFPTFYSCDNDDQPLDYLQYPTLWTNPCGCSVSLVHSGMVAAIGMIVPDLFGRFGGYLSPSMDLTLGGGWWWWYIKKTHFFILLFWILKNIYIIVIL